MLPTGWHVAHVVLLAVWAGVVLAEVVLELAARRDPTLERGVARLHARIDVLVEAPLLAAVVLTGAVLLARAPVIDGWLWAKALCGLGAVAANAACVVAVLRRQRAADDAREAARWTRWVLLSPAPGVPLALLALYLGGARGGWW
ncbi:MAG: hypothetical protein KF878_38250 [Planctomycetes bacterium]|nr:hypothetical protein [Planctomycetota bacterium]